MSSGSVGSRYRGVLCLSIAVVLSSGILQVNAGEPYYGKFLGSLRTQHHGVTGDVYVVDSRNFHIRNFNYDGEGPAAYFYAGNSKAPSSSGFQLRDEKGKSLPLRKYRNEHVTITLPDGKTLNHIKWLSVWCDEYAVNFADVKIPKNFEYPKPQKIGQLNGIHGVSSDNVIIVDAQTLLIQSFSYDGEAPDAKFWVGRGPTPSPQGIRVPDENGKETPLKRYNRKHIVLTLPRDLTVFDIGHFGVWCEAFTVDFGHVEIPQGNLNVPPSLKMLGVSPQKSPQPVDQLLGLVDQKRQESVSNYDQRNQQTQQVYYQPQSSELQPTYQPYQPQLLIQQPLQYAQVAPQPQQYILQQSVPVTNQQQLLQQPPLIQQQHYIQQQSLALYDPSFKQQYFIDPSQQIAYQPAQQPQAKPADQQTQTSRNPKRIQSQTNKRQQPAEFYDENNVLKYDNVLPLLNIRKDTLRPTTYKPPLRQYLVESTTSNRTSGVRYSSTINQQSQASEVDPKDEIQRIKDATVVQIVPSIAISPPSLQNVAYPPELAYNNIYDPNLVYYDNGVRFVDESGRPVQVSQNQPVPASPQPEVPKPKPAAGNQTQTQATQPQPQIQPQFSNVQFSPESLIAIPQSVEPDFQTSVQYSPGNPNLSVFRPSVPFNIIEQPDPQAAQYSGSGPPQTVGSLGGFRGPTNLKQVDNQLFEQQSSPYNQQPQNDGKPPLYPTNIQPDNVRIVTYNQGPHLQQLRQAQNAVFVFPSIQDPLPPGPIFEPSIEKAYTKSQDFPKQQNYLQRPGRAFVQPQAQSFAQPQDQGIAQPEEGPSPGSLRSAGNFDYVSYK